MEQKDEIILININGTDRPGVTAALTEILAKNNAVILTSVKLTSTTTSL